MAVRHALARDLPGLARTLADAFDDDPPIRFLFPDDDVRRRALPAFFSVSLSAGLRRGHTYTTEHGAGAAIWAPPDVRELNRAEGDSLAAVLEEHCGPTGLQRLAAFAQATHAHHPQSPPHFYLFIAGVSPTSQGSGVGGQLLRPVLASCDRDRTPAYLESSNPRNVPFYERLGFEVVSEIPIEGGPVMRGMWREPRGMYGHG
jgi:ribosomal protein S18 acetylase RimI-like enzyme